MFKRLKISDWRQFSNVDISATALIKETIASLAIFGYGNQSVVANENAKKLFEGYADILKIVLPPKLGFEGISVIVPEVMLCTKTGNFPIDAVSGGISSIIDELIKFCRGTGLRRRELQELRGKDLVSREQIEAELAELEEIPKAQQAPSVARRLEILRDTQLFPEAQSFIHVRNGKGGRERLSPIIGKHADQIAERIADTPAEEKVWQHIHTSADIHGYRAEYATAIYKAHARAIEDIPYDKVNRGTGRRYQSEVYTCRKDEAGRKLDKAAMLVCSKALGHNRISVVADNYIRGL